MEKLDKKTSIKNVLLTILLTIIFFGGAYFMGNYVLNTFNEDFNYQMIGSLYGILLWFGIGITIFIGNGIYKFLFKLRN